MQNAYKGAKFTRQKRKTHQMFVACTKVIGGLGVGALCIGGMYLIFYTNALQVKKIEVINNQLAEKEEIKTKVATTLIKEGKRRALVGPANLLFWLGSDRKMVQTETLPQVKEVEVSADMLRKTIILNVKERSVLGMWCENEDSCYGFDEKGILFIKTPRVSGSLFLKIESENRGTVALGKPILTKQEHGENVLKTLSVLREKGWLIREVRIKNASLNEWEVETKTNNPITMKFSLAFVPDNIENILEDMKEKMKKQNLSVIDMRIENRIYYK